MVLSHSYCSLYPWQCRWPVNSLLFEFIVKYSQLNFFFSIMCAHLSKSRLSSETLVAQSWLQEFEFNSFSFYVVEMVAKVCWFSISLLWSMQNCEAVRLPSFKWLFLTVSRFVELELGAIGTYLLTFSAQLSVCPNYFWLVAWILFLVVS